MGRGLKQYLSFRIALLAILVQSSNSSPSSPFWKSDGGGQVKFINGTPVTQTEFDGNAYASAAMGMIVSGLESACLGAVVSDKYFLYSESSYCVSPNTPTGVKVGSIHPFFDGSNFDGETYNIAGISHPPAVPTLGLAQISLLPTSKAKPVPLPPTSLLHTPPPVGSICNAWGFPYGVGSLSRLAVTIVSILECKSQWGTYNSSVVIPENGTVFCAWVTSNGTAEAEGNICDNFSTVVICEDWTAPTPTTEAPTTTPTTKRSSCGWHRSGSGGHRTASDDLAMDGSRRDSPVYLLAGFFRDAFGISGNCETVGPPVIYTYTGGVISSI